MTDIVLRTMVPGACVEPGGNLAAIRLAYSTGADNGNVASQQVSDGFGWSASQSYTCDKLNRLRSATEGVSGPGWKYTFGYDAWGNAWVDETQSYGLLTDGNRPVGSGWFTLKNRLNLGAGTFDAAGNQKQFNPWTLTHDAENRMVQAAKAGLTETYTYDGEGRRVTKVSGTLTTYYVYTADGELAAEYEVGTGGGSMLHAGARGYVVKQDAANDLIAAMRAVSAGRYFITPAVGGVTQAGLPGKPRRHALTPRQTEVLQLIAEGKTAKQIASLLNISVRTAEFHKASIVKDLGLRTTAELVLYAVRQHMLE